MLLVKGRAVKVDNLLGNWPIMTGGLGERKNALYSGTAITSTMGRHCSNCSIRADRRPKTITTHKHINLLSDERHLID